MILILPFLHDPVRLLHSIFDFLYFWCFFFDNDNGVNLVLHDPFGHLPGQVEDRVLVGLDGLGGVDDEDKRGVERTIGGLPESALGGLGARLAPGGKYIII